MDLIATTAEPKLSKASKMPCKSWSLQAIDTCPGSRKSNGELVDACANCYADKGFYNMPSVKAPREHNREDWKAEDWAPYMVVLIGEDKRFRWFDSGDCYDVRLAEKIYYVMKHTPNTEHWFPTRMYKFDKFKPILAKMARLPNVVVRKSSDSIVGKRVRGATTSTIIQDMAQAKGAHVCPASVKGNSLKCAANNCFACWDKSVSVVAYNFH